MEPPTTAVVSLQLDGPTPRRSTGVKWLRPVMPLSAVRLEADTASAGAGTGNNTGVPSVEACGAKARQQEPHSAVLDGPAQCL